MTSSTKSLYADHRFPPELISYTVWLYFRFPLSLRMVEEMLAFRGIGFCQISGQLAESAPSG
jgi:putative transposase